MQDIVINMRGTRAFNRVTGRVLTLALTASALGLSAVAPAQTPTVPAGGSGHAAQAAGLSHAAPSRLDEAAGSRRQAAFRHSMAELTRDEILTLTRHHSAVQVASATPMPLLPVMPLRVLAVSPLPSLSGQSVRPAFVAPTLPVQPRAVKPVTGGGSSADVTLDFVDADISDVLKALSLQTRTNIVCGPDVKGNVTVSLAHVSLENALNMISHLSGFQYSKQGNTYLVGGMADMGTAQGQLTGSIHFDFSEGSDLVSAIKLAFPNVRIALVKTAGGGTETKDTTSIDPSGKPVDTKETTVAATTGGSVNVIGTAEEIAAVRAFIAQTEASFPQSQVLAPPKARIMDLDEAQTVVYHIRYASADDLQSVLTRLVPSVLVTAGPSQRKAPVAPSTADATGVTSTTTSYGAQPTSAAEPTSAAGAGVAVQDGGVVTSVTGNMVTKPTTDSLLLTGSASDVARAQTILSQIDVQPAQINFEAKVTDLDVTLARDLGLGYSFAGANTTVGQVTSAGAASSTTQYRTLLPVGYTPLSQFVNVQLYADQTKGDARILASPNISAVDDQPAAIFIGDNVTYVSSITQGTTGENVVTNTISAGIKLFITGKVDNDGYITVNLHPEVSTYKFTAGAGGTELPDISTREATTTLRVRDGDYIALGGLAESNEAKSTVGVPLLSDIPILGNLFRYDSKQREQREIVIFIKVSIQKDGTVSAAPAQP